MKPCGMNCGGTKHAVWTPVLTLYGRPNTMGAPAILGIRVCDDCRDKATVDDFLTDDGYKMLADGFARAGKMRPRRNLTTLEWKLVDETEHPFDGTPFAGSD